MREFSHTCFGCSWLQRTRQRIAWSPSGPGLGFLLSQIKMSYRNGLERERMRKVRTDACKSEVDLSSSACAEDHPSCGFRASTEINHFTSCIEDKLSFPLHTFLSSLTLCLVFCRFIYTRAVGLGLACSSTWRWVHAKAYHLTIHCDGVSSHVTHIGVVYN